MIYEQWNIHAPVTHLMSRNSYGFWTDAVTRISSRNAQNTNSSIKMWIVLTHILTNIDLPLITDYKVHHRSHEYSVTCGGRWTSSSSKTMVGVSERLPIYFRVSERFRKRYRWLSLQIAFAGHRTRYWRRLSTDCCRAPNAGSYTYCYRVERSALDMLLLHMATDRYLSLRMAWSSWVCIARAAYML